MAYKLEDSANLTTSDSGLPYPASSVQLESDVQETGATEPSTGIESTWIGKRVGSYEIERLISSGGMGQVFLARRADGQFHNEVAIKIMRSAIDTPIARRRFLIERRIVGTLKHDNIARLLDGGDTHGVPYLVMEFVDGLHLDEYCASVQLNIDQRLLLFERICTAVEYAHQKLILHLDLKPSNILVLQEGDPKLLDFGAARILTEIEGEEAVRRDDQIGYTPGYVAPEVMEHGGQVSTASDVYSLGCILYRLFTGAAPTSVGIRVQQPRTSGWPAHFPKPADAVIQHDGAGDDAVSIRRGLPAPQTLAAALRGDLGIVMAKCLEEDPTRRYSNVLDLRIDIKRYRRGFPISARPRSIPYLAKMFYLRNWKAMLVAVAGLLILLCALIALLWQTHIASAERMKSDKRLLEVERIAQKIVLDYSDSIKKLPGALGVSKQLDQDTANFLAEIERSVPESVDTIAYLAATYQRLSRVQGGYRQLNMGEVDNASRSSYKAYQLYRRLLQLKPNDPHYRAEMASVILDIANDAMRRSNFPAARAHFDEALHEIEQVASRNEADAKIQNTYAGILLGMAQLYGDHDGNFKKELEVVGQAEAISENVLEVDGGDYAARDNLADSLRLEGLAIQNSQSKPVEARELFLRAVALRRLQLTQHPSDVSEKCQLALDLMWAARMSIRTNRGVPSIIVARDELADADGIIAPLVQADRQDVFLKATEATVLQNLLETYLRLSEKDKVGPVFGKLTAFSTELIALDPNSNDYVALEGTVLEDSSKIAILNFNWPLAKRSYDKAVSRLLSLASRDNIKIRHLAGYQADFSELLIAQGFDGEAIATLVQSLHDIDRLFNDKAGVKYIRMIARVNLLLGRAWHARALRSPQTRGDDTVASLKYYRAALMEFDKIEAKQALNLDDAVWIPEAKAALANTG